MLLRDLSPKTFSPELHLYLRHMWSLCDPVRPEQFFALSTIWTDQEGSSDPGRCVRNFAVVIEKRIMVGFVYKINNFCFVGPVSLVVLAVFPIGWLSQLLLSSSSSYRPMLLSRMRFSNMFH
ncbi:hypothetical protein LINGRAHAP2_LOCUS14056 [Linum grandiflorum]